MTTHATSQTALVFPFPVPPETGQTIEVAPGIRLLRLALPFRLDHVNVYLIDDQGGTVVLDTGIGDEGTQAIWERLLETEFRDRPVSRIIASHFHPDHVGMAGWLCERLGVPLLMSQTEYLTCQVIHLDPHALNAEPYRSFYLGHGLDEEATERLLTGGQHYLRMMTGLPPTFRRLIAGETLILGGRSFHVLTGGGHAPEQVMLHCPDDRLLLCADQVLARISPNVSVQAMDPDGDPLGIYLRSLASLRDTIPADTLVLPGHNVPFIGLHQRVAELMAHHEERCSAIFAACRAKGFTVAELVPVVFRRPIDDPHQMGFAFSEAFAHVNLMMRQGRLRFADGRYHADGA